MNKRSEWLLEYVRNLYPLGITRLHNMPTNTPLGVSLITLRNLERHGYVIKSGPVWFITKKGKNFLKRK